MAVLAASVIMAATPVSAFAATILVNSFVGTSDRDTRALGIGLQPPDVNGAVGLTQFAQLQNGSFAAYNKSTGALLAPRITDSQFFINAGGEATGGDVRIRFDTTSSRWIAIGFGATADRLQIAVSNTADVLGGFRSVAFNALPTGVQPGGAADYPTLALSGNTVTIGTNDFFATTVGAARTFQGTTLNIINRADLFGAGAPTITSLQRFVTPGTIDRGFAIQEIGRAHV